MSNNIYDILKKMQSLEAPKQNLTEGKKAKPDFADLDKDGDKKEPMKKAAKEKAKGGIAEAVARVEQQLAEKYMTYKKRLGEESDMKKTVIPVGVIDGTGGYEEAQQRIKDYEAGKINKDGKPLPPIEDRSRPADKPKTKEVDESGLQAYLGKKKYGEQGMKALQKAGRDGASKEKMAKIRARHDKMDEGEYDKYSEIQPEHIKARPGSSDPRGTREYQTGIYPDPDLERVGMGAYGPKAKIIPKIQGIAPEKRGEYMSYFNDDNMPHDSKHTKIFLPNPKKGDTYDDLLKNADHYTVFGLKTPSTLDKIKRAVGIDEGNQLPSPPDEVHLPKKGSKHGPVDVYRKKTDEGSYNEDMLSPGQKKIAKMSPPPNKIDANDLAALRAGKKKKAEGNAFSGAVAKAKATGQDEFNVGGKEYKVQEGWDEMLKAQKERSGPKPSGGSGIKQGTRYGGGRQTDEPDTDNETGEVAKKGRGRPKKDKFAK